jgi:hypothetical protein
MRATFSWVCVISATIDLRELKTWFLRKEKATTPSKVFRFLFTGQGSASLLIHSLVGKSRIAQQL